YSHEMREQDGVVIVRVVGHLDTHTAPKLEEVLTDLLARTRFRVVLDLAQLGYISSAGLGVLAGTLGAFREQGGDLKVAGPPGNVLRVLDLLGFTRLLDVHASVQEAVTAYNK
ncbi:MAG: STAS domain-containing protein, partial [Cyanobacteria bacterium REEB65]|nr:STAS domain-containing protein [Cyanobacteria bacterium REEB65]